MTYAQFGKIEATDYNNLIGTSPGTTANRLNTVLAVGGSAAGYGQTALADVSVGNLVEATNWANLISTTANVATHQGTSITAVTAPAVGNVITHSSAITNNLTTIYNNRLNAIAQGGTYNNSIVSALTWSNFIQFTQVATFTSGDAARYFFNAGGQLAFTFSHPAGSGINALFNQLLADVGTVVVSSVISGSINIAGTNYNGVTKIGGAGNTPIIDTTKGYYGLSSSPATIFTQTASTGPGYYLSSNLSISVVTNGTQGTNNDTGSILTFTIIIDEVPNGLTASTGTTCTLTVRPPSTSYLANTWGTVTLSGSVTAT